MEMICAIVQQLTKDLTTDEIEKAGLEPYFVDHTVGLWPQSAGGLDFSSKYFQSKGDPITDLTEDLAAEQKARTTYDNILRLVDNPDVIDPIKFLREREIVHFQRFGETEQSIWNDYGGVADNPLEIKENQTLIHSATNQQPCLNLVKKQGCFLLEKKNVKIKENTVGKMCKYNIENAGIL